MSKYKRRSSIIEEDSILIDIKDEPIVISKVTSDLILKQDHPSDLMALYWFYYYTAKWQQTKKIKSTTGYTAKGLKWSDQKVRDRKQQLIKLGLIDNVTARDKNTNRITGHYILVKFIWWDKEKIESHPHGFPEYGKSHSVGNHRANALSTNRLNALKTNSKKDSKESLSDSSESPKSIYLEKWNSFQSTQSHNSPNTKTYKKARQYFFQLVRGTFWQNKVLDEDWWKRCKIPQSWKTKRWPRSKLLEGLESLEKLFLEGYWPPDKSKLPRDLPSLLYNSNTGKSFFFQVLNDIPESNQNKFRDKYSKLTKLITDEYDFEISRDLVFNVSDLVEFNKSLNRSGRNGSGKYVERKLPLKNPERLVKSYLRFLEFQDWIEEYNVKMFNPKHKIFKMWIKDESKDIGVDMITGKLLG